MNPSNIYVSSYEEGEKIIGKFNMLTPIDIVIIDSAPEYEIAKDQELRLKALGRLSPDEKRVLGLDQ